MCSYLAYPAEEDGVVVLQDANGLRIANKVRWSKWNESKHAGGWPETRTHKNPLQNFSLLRYRIEQIPAHRSKLAALAFSLDGALLATASELGTVIRVFR